MKYAHKLLFEFVNKFVRQWAERRHEASFKDMVIMDALGRNVLINLYVVMIKVMARVIDPAIDTHGLAYGFILTTSLKLLG